MKLFVVFALALTACGQGSQTKEFFENTCKNIKPLTPIAFKTVTEDNEEDKSDASPTPEPAPPDYNNRCSENDKRQIIADWQAKGLRQFADMVAQSTRGPSTAEVEVSRERASTECDKLRACSGLPLEVTIPQGDQEYHCGMRNGQNWIEIGCAPPDADQ
jgi:hypothetical protein